MKKLAYIHIGFGKTGTSSIQKFLLQNRESLLEQGILYPMTGLVDSAHHGLCPLGQNTDENHLNEIYENLVDEIKNESPSKLIISSEHFSFAGPAVIEKIREKTQSFDTKIIFYTRPQTSLIESTFLQWQKYGSNYLGDIRAFWKIHVQAFDFLKKITPWEQRFGINNNIAKVYDMQQDVRPEFSKIVHIDNTIGITISSDRDNLSLNPIFSNLICLIDKNTLSNRENIMEEIMNISSNCKIPKLSLLSDLDLQEIKEIYAESNNKFANRFLNGEDALTLMSGYILNPIRTASDIEGSQNRTTLTSDERPGKW